MPDKYHREVIRQKRATSPWALFLLCLALTTVATFVALHFSRAVNKAHFERSASALADAFRIRMDNYTNSLVITRNLFQLNPRLTAEQFHSFVSGLDVQAQYPGMQTIGYVRRVAARDLRSFQRQIPADRRNTLRTKDFYDLVHYTKNYIYTSHSAVGNDLSDSPLRSKALALAAETGRPAATTLVQPLSIPRPEREDSVFLIYVPHYATGSALDTPAQRRAALRGVVFGAFRAVNLFDEVMGDTKLQMRHLILRAYDGSSIHPSTLMFTHGDLSRTSDGYRKTFPLSAANHTWTIHFAAEAGFMLPYTRYFPWAIFLVGLLLTAVVTWSALRANSFAAKLLEDIDQRLLVEKQLRDEKQITELVSKIGTNLKAEQDLEQIVQMVTDVVNRLTEGEIAAFFYNVGNDSNETLKPYTLSGSDKNAFEKFGMPRATPIFKLTFDGTEIIRSDDITKDPRYGTNPPNHDMPAGHLPVRSYLAVPVKSKTGAVLGGLFIGHSQPGRFGDRAESIACALAVQAGVAMDNAKLCRDLGAANRAKSIFLANVSHEIRTPLGIMMGYAELAQERRQDPAAVEECTGTILRNGRELTRIIGEVLDLSKIEANTLLVESANIMVDRFLEDVVAPWRQEAASKGLEFHLEKGATLPSSAWVDPTRLKQILVNLLSNAVKFTDQGHVTLRVEPAAAGDALIFRVEDTGPGISDSHRTQLFKPFSQGDNSITRKYGGSGLGLALSRQLALALGGQLTLEWNDREGTVFKLHLPTNAPPISAQPSHDLDAALSGPEGLHDVRVLLVEDSKDNQNLVKAFLQKAVASVDVASNGEEGCRLALGGHHDVVLMDIQMPILDGYGAMERLQSTGYGSPVIALTAHALREEKEKAMSRGFADYVTKPIDRQALFAALHRAVET